MCHMRLGVLLATIVVQACANMAKLTTTVVYDGRSTNIIKPLVDSYLGANVTYINFFTSDIDELAVISKYRVVSLPTLVMCNDSDVVLRMSDIIGVPQLKIAQTIQSSYG